MGSGLALLVLGFAVWVILCWVPDSVHLLVGLSVAAFVAFLSGGIFLERPTLLRHPMRYGYFLFVYLPLFLWECLKANMDVAYRVLHPSLPIDPGIVRIKTELKTDIALTFLANSITLTPGTMVVDIDKEEGILYIHWIYVKTTDTEEATRATAATFEPLLKKIFE